MNRKIIAISGGSGCGKSTLTYALQDIYPKLIEVLHFDDYQKQKEDIPITDGIMNWDHPEAIDFDCFVKDLKKLRKGKDVEIMTKSEKHNPEYKDKGRISVIMKSKEIVIVEGYMVLFDERARKLFDFSVFLDLHHDVRMKRRTKFINDEYVNKILYPMHKKYVEPTKKYADLVVDIEKLDKKEVLELVIKKLKEKKILRS